MKKLICILILFLCVSCSNLAFAANEKKTADIYKTGYSYTYALSQKKPMLVYFYTNWCSSCKKFTPILKLINEIYSNSYNFVFIDGDDKYNQKIMSEFKFEYYPSLFIVDKQGTYKKLINSRAYYDIERLKFELDSYLAKNSQK